MDIKELLKQLGEVKSSLQSALEKQSQEIADQGEASTKTGQRVDQITTDLVAVQGEVTESVKATQERMDALELLVQEDADQQKNDPLQSPGEIVVKSDAFDRIVKGDTFALSPVKMKTLFPEVNWGTKANLLSDVATRFIEPQRLPGFLSPMLRNLRMRDLIPVRPTQSNAIEYIEETGFAADGAGAGTQTHGAAAEVAEGGVKPETQMEFTLNTVPIQTIAHWIPASRQVLADEGQLQSYLNDRLRYGVLYKEDSQLLYGTGTSPQIQGIMTATGIQTWVESTDSVIGDTKIDSLRKAMTKAHVAEHVPTGLVLNPNDWEAIQLIKGSDEHYIWLSVATGTEQMFFLVPIVITNAITAGEALLGAFATGSTVWDREQVTVRTSESHASFFTSNLVALLAEERMAQTIYRPEAFVKVTLDDAPIV